MEGTGDESSVNREIYGREGCDGTDEDGFLSNCMIINAKNTLVKEGIWINRVAGQFVFQPLHRDTDAPLHDERITASKSTSEMSLMYRGHPGNSLFAWTPRVCDSAFPPDTSALLHDERVNTGREEPKWHLTSFY